MNAVLRSLIGLLLLAGCAREMHGPEKLQRARTQFQLGKEALEKGAPQTALPYLKRGAKVPFEEQGEALFLLGRAYYETGDGLFAVRTFERLSEKYPYHQRLSDAAELEYRIAMAALQKGKRRIRQGHFFRLGDRAEEVLKRSLLKSPQGEFADQIRLTLGDLLYEQEQYAAAALRYEEVVEQHPGSPWVQEALWKWGRSLFHSSAGADFAQTPLIRAEEKLLQYQEDFPQGAHSEEVNRLFQRARSRRAKHAYRIARFYVRQGKPGAARLYYEKAVSLSPDSRWGRRGAEKLDDMNDM